VANVISKEERFLTDRILINALKEDIGNGDITTNSLIPEKHVSHAVLFAKSDCILAGLPFAERTFNLIDNDIQIKNVKKDGSRIKVDEIIAKIKGSTRSLLMAERVALNILQRLSGIATITDSFVRRIKGLKTKIVDTRKTVPGLRLLDKYAVRTGGGHNHRYGLFDGVLIKDNHIAAVGGVGKAVKLARSKSHHFLKTEVEVKTFSEVNEALAAGADIIMLDNMSVDEMKKAVEIIRRKKPGVLLEASGNINLENVRIVAETGIDLISVGALTHSAPAADISMKFN
jgi:nicotinate-nucleotide pyrophosphorylase (carboxylating)